MDQDDSPLASTLPKALQQHLLQGLGGHPGQADTVSQRSSPNTELFGPADPLDQPSNSYSQNKQPYANELLSFPSPYPRPVNFRPQSWHGGDPNLPSTGNAPLPPIRTFSLTTQASPPGVHHHPLASEPTSPLTRGHVEHGDWDNDSNLASATEHDSPSSYDSLHRQRRGNLRHSQSQPSGEFLFHDSPQRIAGQSALFQTFTNDSDTKEGIKKAKTHPEYETRRIKKSDSPSLSDWDYDPSEKDKGKATKRKKTAVACDFCRGRKLRCDGKKPMCGNCEARNTQECKYVSYVRRRGPGKAPKGSRKKRKEPDTGQGGSPGHFAGIKQPKAESLSPTTIRSSPFVPHLPVKTETNVPSPYTPFHDVFSNFEPAAAGFPYRPRHPVDYEGTGLHFIYNPQGSGFGSSSFANAPPRIGSHPSALDYPSRQRSSSQFAFPQSTFPESISTALPTSVRYQPHSQFSDGGAFWQDDTTAGSSSEAALFGRRPGSFQPAFSFHAQNEPYIPRQLTSSERDAGSTEQRYGDVQQPGLDPSLNYRAGGFGLGPRFAEGAQGDRTLARFDGSTAETRTGPYEYEEYSATSQQIGLGDSQTNPRTFRPRPNPEQHHQQQRYSS